MRPEIAVAAVHQQNEAMIERAVEHMLAHVAPAGGGQGGVHVGVFQGGAHLVDGHGHQAGMAVHPVTFIGHPIGAHVAFFEHMDAQACGAGKADRLCMDRAGVAIEHQVGHRLLGDQHAQPRGPVLDRAGIGDIAFAVVPERAVALVEPHAPHLCPGRAQHLAEPVEERPVRPLKEKECPAHRSSCSCGRAPGPVCHRPVSAVTPLS